MKPYLLLAGMLLAPAAAAAQIEGGIAEVARLRADGGLRVLSLGGFGYTGSAQPAGELAGSLGLRFQPLLLGIEGGVARSADFGTSGGGRLSAAFPWRGANLQLRVGRGLAQGPERGASVTTGGVQVARGRMSFSVTSNVMPGMDAVYRDTVIELEDTTWTARILERHSEPRALYADAEVGWSLAAKRLELHAVAGHRVGDAVADRWWARLGSSYAVGPDLALGAIVGIDPGAPWRHTPARGFATFFMRFDPPRTLRRPPPRAAALVRSMRIASDQRTHFTVVAPGARAVEMAGDFTDWQPVPLHRASDGSWQAILPVAPGVYHVSVRANGGPWLAPPGLPAVPDELGGETGVFEVR